MHGCYCLIVRGGCPLLLTLAAPLRRAMSRSVREIAVAVVSSTDNTPGVLVCNAMQRNVALAQASRSARLDAALLRGRKSLRMICVVRRGVSPSSDTSQVARRAIAEKEVARDWDESLRHRIRGHQTPMTR